MKKTVDGHKTYYYLGSIIQILKDNEPYFLSLHAELEKQYFCDFIIFKLSTYVYAYHGSCGTARGSAVAALEFFREFNIGLDGGELWSIDILINQNGGPAVIFGGAFLTFIFESIARDELKGVIPDADCINRTYLIFISDRIRHLIVNAESLGQIRR